MLRLKLSLFLMHILCNFLIETVNIFIKDYWSPVYSGRPVTSEAIKYKICMSCCIYFLVPLYANCQKCVISHKILLKNNTHCHLWKSANQSRTFFRRQFYVYTKCKVTFSSFISIGIKCKAIFFIWISQIFNHVTNHVNQFLASS